MTKFQCSNCRYKFETKSKEMPKNCPYCGKEETLTFQGEAEFWNINELLK